MRVLCNVVSFLVSVKMNLHCICRRVFAFVVVASAYFDDFICAIFKLYSLFLGLSEYFTNAFGLTLSVLVITKSNY